ncbi:MAG: hypothetical protein WC809_01055 [Sinimarinibacterium sp.]|jgi:hypothetical protein
MNKLPRKSLSVLVAASLLGFSSIASADGSLSQRVATGVGRVIAAQGNAALDQIREELGQTIEKTIQPWLPTQDVQASNAALPKATPSATAAL